VDDLLSEKEQIEQIRSWWSEYGGYVIGGLGLGIAILVGYNFYQNSKLEAQLAGSAMYETLTSHVVDGKLDEAEQVADTLAAEYGDTAYAAQAKLALARLYMDRNRDQDAADVLQELLDSDADVALKQVGRTRLARVLLYQGNAQEVVDLLEGQESTAFAAIWGELLGDAYHELGRNEDAAEAYQRAMLDPMAQATVDQRLVQWKLLDLPEPESQTGETAAPEDVSEAAPADEPVDEAAVEESGDEGSE
jgi:predicted negative regulator of RcsB-dependent stress response